MAHELTKKEELEHLILDTSNNVSKMEDLVAELSDIEEDEVEELEEKVEEYKSFQGPEAGTLCGDMKMEILYRLSANLTLDQLENLEKIAQSSQPNYNMYVCRP